MRLLSRSVAPASLALLLSAVCGWSQDRPPVPAAGDTVLQTGVQMVVIDVSVRAPNGRPIAGLTCRDFDLKDESAPQRLAHCEEHHRQEGSVPHPAPALPPGTFANYGAVSGGGALNVILLDFLNTRNADLGYVRKELRDWVDHAPTNVPTAVFALQQRLTFLQGFTDDPRLLHDAVYQDLNRTSANRLDSGATSGPSAGSPAMADLLSESNASGNSAMQHDQALSTLDAFNQLAHYLEGFPGRKNVIWFSGAFPLQVATGHGGLDTEDILLEYQRTTNLLTKAQVALYPVDSAGLPTDPTNVAKTGASPLSRPTASFGANQFYLAQSKLHAVMDDLASDTGGRAFYNTNGIADAARTAIADGSDYYTLSYIPGDHRSRGQFHRVDVKLNGEFAKVGAQLSYRRGYYAEDDIRAVQAATVSPSAASHMASLAVAHGAPPTSEIPFKVQIEPIAGEARSAVSGSEHPTPDLKGPFRLYDIHLVTLPGSFHFEKNPQGRNAGGLELSARLYDADGRLCNVSGLKVGLEYNDAELSAFRRTPVRLNTRLSAPVHGDYYVRVVMEDRNSHRIGSMEIPLRRVNELPAVPEPDAPAASGQ